MNKTEKIRIAVFIIILVVLSYFSVGYTYEIFSMNIDNYFIDTGNINDVNIDGSDVTPIFHLMGYGMNTFVGFLMYGIYAIIIGIVSLVLIIPFRLIGLKKYTKLTVYEMKITKWCFVGVTILSIMIGLMITRCTLIIPLLTYTAIWTIIVFFIYVLSVLKRGGEVYKNSERVP